MRTATGQHRQRGAWSAGPVANRSAEVKVPANGNRVRMFIGLAPATGTLLLDDVSIKVRPGFIRHG